MIAALPIEYARCTFLDIGSGKGRALLLAAEFPFRRILGVEALPELHAAAEANLRKRRERTGDRREIVSLCADARDFKFPEGPLVVYLFNPLPEPALRALLRRLEDSLRTRPRDAWIVYHNPLLAHLVEESGEWQRRGGTHQYVLYEWRAEAE